jgi:hypothetical protein
MPERAVRLKAFQLRCEVSGNLIFSAPWKIHNSRVGDPSIAPFVTYEPAWLKYPITISRDTYQQGCSDKLQLSFISEGIEGIVASASNAHRLFFLLAVVVHQHFSSHHRRYSSSFQIQIFQNEGGSITPDNAQAWFRLTINGLQ